MFPIKVIDRNEVHFILQANSRTIYKTVLRPALRCCMLNTTRKCRKSADPWYRPHSVDDRTRSKITEALRFFPHGFRNSIMRRYTYNSSENGTMRQGICNKLMRKYRYVSSNHLATFSSSFFSFFLFHILSCMTSQLFTLLKHETSAK